MAVGKNLFETLMLNLIFLEDGQTLFNEDVPCWELPVPRSAERTEVAVPDNFAGLMTLQSRRLLLKEQGGAVFFLIAGISATLGRHSLKRGLQVFFCGLAASAVTAAAGFLCGSAISKRQNLRKTAISPCITPRTVV